ncbi:hypothetical protein scyTo_0011390 [Scyliorhinus torazame]|uniref:Laminin N-terminal domain-containing protein n=1 Tax=Scyliorhinus torazame TaxID=75743 RepID=A0A401NLY1_SCYTO|nr:hypothetical protein [Scyliorhinus torazame]
MFLLFLNLVFSSCVTAQTDCSQRACYPTPGDLVIGRVDKLQASSTCGLYASERYCSPKMYYGRDVLQCCVCDSRNEYNPVYFTNSYRIKNVVPSGALRSWWQSENDLDQVYIQLDMEGKFQLNDILLRFKSPRPAAMMIERSTDFGQTWKPYQYFADDCAASFPQIQTGQPHSFDDAHCQVQPRNQDSSDDQVTFNPLKLIDYISGTKSDKINNIAPFTNLRINFIKPYKPTLSHELHNVNHFYAVYDMRFQGSCFCNGHASSCTSEDNSVEAPQGARKMIQEQCVCKHNTAGRNCEVCASFYNDQPWKPADDYNTNQCKKCNCNNHSQKCRFDPEVHRDSGGISGGVCDDCEHNTIGSNCEKCKPSFYRRPGRDITAIDTCIGDRTTTTTVLVQNARNVIVTKVVLRPADVTKVQDNACATQALPGSVVTNIVDNQLSTLNIQHKALVNIKLPAHVGNHYDSEIRALDNKLQQVEAIMDNPAVTDSTVTNVHNNYKQLRVEAEQINPDTDIVDQSYRLSNEMDVLDRNVKTINSQLQSTKEKIELFISEDSQGTQGTFNNILSSYQQSGKAKDGIVAVEPIILKSREARLTANQLIKHINTDNRNKLENLKHGLKSPNVNPLINKICGGSRMEPCTAERCPGDLCPEPCEGINCQGTLHLAKKAIEDAERGSISIPDVSNRITELAKRIENTDQKAQQMKSNALRLTNQVASVNNQMKKNIADIKTFIATIKDFLTSTQADPDEIQRISEYVLSLKLPTDAITIRDKINSLRNIAARIPDVSEILANTQDDVIKAKILLKDANEARDRASRVKNNIDKVKDALADANKALKNVNDMIEDATEAIDTVQDQSTKIEDKLTHTETNLLEMTERLRNLTNRINNLQKQNDLNWRKATALETSALVSRSLGDEAEQNLKQLISLHGKLQNNVPESLPKDLIDRVNHIRFEADHYFKDVQQRVQEIGKIEQDLAKGNKQLEMKFSQLDNYQDQVTKIKEFIESQAQYYDQCAP